MPVAVAYGRWSLIREVVALGGSTMSSVDYFTTVLSKLAYAKNETQLLCPSEKTPHLLEECGVYSRIIRKTSVQLGNLHHPDIYDSISAN